MSQYLGDISAYALAVSQGYTGTEEEYAELMASYATVGQTAVTAAQTATTKASEAATSATTATNKATEATTAATTATTKAQEAVANAEAAARDASQAMAAESTATSKATEATTAAATATSAKTDAVAANTAAQSAKTAAQTAQTGAETAAASVESSAEQIATNVEDISQLKSDLTMYDDGKKPFPGTYQYATLNTSGEFVDRADHTRAAIETYYTATEGDTLTVATGFTAILCEYNSSNVLLNRELKVAGTYTLNADSKYRISSYYTTQQVIQNLSEVAFGVLIMTNTQKQITGIDEEVDRITETLIIEKSSVNTNYSDGYVSNTEKGIHTTPSSAKYKYSNLIFLKKGCRISVTFHDTNSAVAIISIWKSDGSFLKAVALGNSQTGEQTASYVAEYDCYIRVSARYDFIATTEKIIDTKTDILKNSVAQEDFGYLLNSFLKIGAVGDSLASGACASNNGTSVTHDIPKHSWLQYMARYYGFTGINFTKGGCYTRGWLDDARYDYQGWTKAQIPENKCNAYFIGLGANDMGAIQAGNFTLGTTADVGTDADSFYGCYSKIITNLKTIQPKAKFFLFTLTWLYTVTSPYDTMVDGINDAIRYIAGQFDNCYVIDLQNDDFYYSADVTGNKRLGHYNAISYNMQAMHLAKLIGNYMHTHQDEFNQLEFIGTDWSWTD